MPSTHTPQASTTGTRATGTSARHTRAPARLLRALFILPVRLYQCTISCVLPPTCRFSPTCSQYTVEAIRSRGVLVGIAKGIWRIMRCNPWGGSGYDPVDAAPPTDAITETIHE